jgi:hypothetical protein
MMTLLPEGEEVRRALLWISDERRLDPKKPLAKVLEEASVRFDLSPAQEAWLFRTLVDGNAPSE